jgi:hypothetical protein
MDMRLYSFPGARRSEEIFPTQGPDPVDEYLLKQPAYVKLHAETQDRCGVINVAGRAVGACFVGAFTAAVGIAELGRYYNDDRRFEVVDISLKNVARASAAVVDGWAGPENLGYCAVN